jgi:hypothetical protein
VFLSCTQRKKERKGSHRSRGSGILPTQETRTETYWTICWKKVKILWWKIKVPYPCIKSRTYTVWCYHFSSVGDHCKVFFETHYGCESGREYEWSDGCLGWFDAYRSSVYKCFEEPLDDLGFCREGYSTPVGGQWPPSYNPTRRAALVAGGSSTILAGLVMVASQFVSIQHYLAVSGPIEKWPGNLLVCTGLPIILGIMAIIASVFTFRQIGRTGRGGLIGGLLAIIIAIPLFISSYLCAPFTLQILIELTFLIVGGILSLLGE